MIIKYPQKNMVDESQPLDFNRLSWFVSGVIIGSILHTTTTMVLILSWIIVTNEPLPKILGGHYPQNILKSIFRYISTKTKRKKKMDKDTSDDINTPVNNEPPITAPRILNIPDINQPIITFPVNNVPVIMNVPSISSNSRSRIEEQ